jgi:valyl-tRNA synthetase
MQGYSALWLPGTDHASIATEAKIVEKMREAGEARRRSGPTPSWNGLEWKGFTAAGIIEQLKRLGSSCDWSRERFTMDDVLSDAVMEVFIRFMKRG